MRVGVKELLWERKELTKTQPLNFAAMQVNLFSQESGGKI